ncbi:MAG: hypothetical protein DWQ07_21185 [Chloroflexi bacterium]|nr:MAG: hypothetical protein DWQ07_21185 [Chloroflexota bacterium]MBL1194598.1 hypothetical protein [Chloroflexota bacterium]NOH11887.1 hypothetical protein [Chloroflexota bacterium]
MRRTVIIAGLIGLATIVVLSGVSPPQQPVPGTDSGVFLYIGEGILEGELPYRDAWDHKGPLIYYINALGQLLRSDSRWGVWLLEVMAVYGAALLSFALMKRAFGELPAIFGSGLWLLAMPTVLSSGNLTEEYALPLQFAALFFFWRSLKDSHWRWPALIGISLALGFLLRPNIVGMPAAILLYWAWQLWRGNRMLAVRQILVVFATAAGLVLLVWGYFAANQAGPQMLDVVLTYNFAYSGSSLTDKFTSLWSGLYFLPVLSVFALAGWGLLVLDLRGLEKGTSRFLYVLALALPIEIILTSISGRAFNHYYMSWLSVFGLLSAYLFHRMLSEFRQSETGFAPALTYVLLAAFSILPLTRILPPFINTVLSPQVKLTESDRSAVLEYVAENVEEDDYLLFWGSELSLNWLSGVSNPSRHIYQAHLLNPGYANAALIDEYLTDIVNSKPLIIDSTVSEGGLPPLDSPPGQWPESLRPVYEFIENNYEFEQNLGPYRWPVYRYVGPEP